MGDALSLNHDYAQRFLLAQFEDGAVMLDLGTGGFYRLNALGARVCLQLGQGHQLADVIQEIARAFAIPGATAERDVSAFLQQLATARPPTSGNPITFRPDDTGQVLQWQGQPCWHIDQLGQTLTYLADPPVTEPDSATQLLWAIPHVLLLQGQLVLHAAAVEDDSEIIAFSGSSGQGKTTLAQLLAKEGWTLVSEDLLVLDISQGTPEVAINGEKNLRAWVAAHAAELQPRRSLAASSLAEAAAGPCLPLGKVFFHQRKEMPAPLIDEQPVGQAEGLLLLLENSFAELGIPEVWGRLWDALCAIATQVPVARLQVPEGLAHLQMAVKDYTRKVTS
jgi:hypothetical protein